MLSTRSTLPEELDNDTTDPATYQRVIAELAVCNRITFTHRPTLRWLGRATKGMTEFSVLDVGHGDGDLLRTIARWADQRGMNVKLSGIDLNPRSAVAARDATPPWMQIDYQTACVFSYTPAEPVRFHRQFAGHPSLHRRTGRQSRGLASRNTPPTAGISRTFTGMPAVLRLPRSMSPDGLAPDHSL